MGIRTDTRTRLLDILNDVDEIVKNTIAPAIAPARQGYEGYVFIVRSVSNAQTLRSSQVMQSLMQWSIELLSPEVGIGLRNVIEPNMYAYADAVYETLNFRPRLENSLRQPLDRVERAIITSDSGLLAPIGYPTGQSVTEYYAYRFSLQVQYITEAC